MIQCLYIQWAEEKKKVLAEFSGRNDSLTFNLLLISLRISLALITVDPIIKFFERTK